jgi:DNA-binding transcriptional ArsR family regulator
MVLKMKKKLSKTCYKFFSTLANPTRLATLENLMDGPMNVSDIAETLEQEQSMISHNLRPLIRCGFVKAERKGKAREYSLNRETVESLFKIVENHAENYCPTGGLCDC